MKLNSYGHKLEREKKVSKTFGTEITLELAYKRTSKPITVLSGCQSVRDDPDNE